MNRNNPDIRMADTQQGNRNHRLKVISLLLGFPDSELIDCLPFLEEAVDRLFPDEAAPKCRTVIAFLTSTPLMRLQETYTATFDLNPAVCLNLTYHRWGDGEDRGKALADIQEAYYRGGYGRAMGELPDYLPMVLEFIAACPDPALIPVFTDYLDALDTIAEGLRKADSPYAGLLEILRTDFAALMQTEDPPALSKGAYAT